jgi:hypothetical protein
MADVELVVTPRASADRVGPFAGGVLLRDLPAD